MENSFKYYRVFNTGREQIIDGFIYYVCGLLGHGKNNNAFIMIRETIMSETLYAQAKDYSRDYGEGLGQFDKIAFEDVQKRANLKHKKIIKDDPILNLDVEKVLYGDLRLNPLLSIIFIRLKYLLIPETIPLSVKDRFNYYKEHYNTLLGKATWDHFLKANNYKAENE